MICGLRSKASVWDSNVRYFPSQPRRKLSAALNTVVVLKLSATPSGAVSRERLLAPFAPTSWQVAQLRLSSRDSRVSEKSRAPRATRNGFATSIGAVGNGVMGSSVVAARVAEPVAQSRAAAIGIQHAARVGQSGRRRSTFGRFRLKRLDGQHEDVADAALGANDTRGARVCLEFATQA